MSLIFCQIQHSSHAFWSFWSSLLPPQVFKMANSLRNPCLTWLTILPFGPNLFWSWIYQDPTISPTAKSCKYQIFWRQQKAWMISPLPPPASLAAQRSPLQLRPLLATQEESSWWMGIDTHTGAQYISKNLHTSFRRLHLFARFKSAHGVWQNIFWSK